MAATRGRRGALGALLAAAAALACAVASPATASPSGDPLTQLAQRDPDRLVEVIVQARPGTSPRAAERFVRASGGRLTRRVRLVPLVGARLRAAEAVRLRRRPELKAVTLNARVEPQAVSVRRLVTAYPQATDALSAWNILGYTGRGVGIAVLDTGIAGDLADFRASRSDGDSRVVGSAVVHPRATTAEDTYGHGTHVAGIIAGNGNNRPSSDPLVGRYIGIAPESHLVSVKVSDDEGRATILDVIHGLQYAVDHRERFDIRVVNLSLESTSAGSHRTDPLDAAVEAAWLKGLVVVAAAGNRGMAADAVHYAPGNDPYAISVGAFDDRGTRAASDDVVASWSSRGTTQDGFAKPDVYAPGARVRSLLAPNSAFASMCPSCVVDGEYIRAGGTSMAAPIVAGAVALLLEREPSLTPDQVKTLLVQKARELPGRIRALDVTAAIRAVPKVETMPQANEGLQPNPLVDPATGEIDYTRSSWSRSSWSTAPEPLTAAWARSSWSCNCSLLAGGSVDPTRSSWSRSSWSTSWGL